jgi:hypothetical protein
MSGVRNQLRLRFIVPLVVVAAGGLAVAKFVVLKDDSSEAEAAGPAVTTEQAETTAPATETAPTPATTAEEQTEPTKTGLAKLETALEKNKIVVVVVYAPDGAVDTLQVSEARSGASDVNAGFLALNGVKEKEIADFATAFGVRTTPIVLVFRRGPELAARFETFADHQTVAQAALNVRQGA